MPSRRKTLIIRWLISIVVVATLVAAAVFAWRVYALKASAAAMPAWVEVRRGNVADQIAASGVVQPLRYVDVGAQVSGQLQRLHVKIGDQVLPGRLLAEIDARTTQAAVLAGEAELQRLRAVVAQYEANQELLRLQANRQRVMFASNATSRDSMETAVAQLRVQEAQIEATRAQIAGQESKLTADRTTLSFTRIIAPAAGTIVTLAATEGQMLNASMNVPVLMRIADLTSMTVTVQVSEADQPRLARGMPVRFSTIGSPNRRYESTLRQVYPTPDVINNVVLYQALFDVPNPDGALLPQMSAQVFFIRSQATGVMILPRAALGPLPPNSIPPRRTVRVLAEDGSISPREISLGIADRINVEVKDGLQLGDKVVLPERTTSAQAMPMRPPR
ncbi:efflux RND transporter periplasmic adaptor subunit [Humitalea sp. 24SJ18S-53]|uniref:efflux RND transporter periplasmic adaptor subunit n=1 Tax=Humitalea sp. 24SJ18S-53 TaxID=3422307 RepID=UPI003D6733F1